MSNIYNDCLKLELFGASHSDAVGIKVIGMPQGIKIDNEYIASELARRKPDSILSNARFEEDEFEFVSGVRDNKTTGEDLVIRIKNNHPNSKNYEKGVIRPSHADYPAYIKYGEDYQFNGGGQFSGRLTAPLVVFGAICKQVLLEKNIHVVSHIAQIGDILDDKATYSDSEIAYLKNHFTLSEKALKNMQARILEVKEDNDSIGGKIEVCATGVEVGLGEDYFGGLESKLSSLFFAIPGVRSVEIGDGAEMAHERGSKVNDPLIYQDGKVNILTNHAGGINGGLTNGNPVVAKVTFRPTASIAKPQNTINIYTKENITYQINGHHDTCIAYRAGVIVEGMMAIGILEEYLRTYGPTWVK